MTNSYYAPGDQRATRVNELFARIAPRYDLINDLQSFGLHRHWKRRVLHLARPQPGETALDVCCGTGDLALALAGSGLRTVGLDFSEPMLAVARQKRRCDFASPGARRPSSSSAREGDRGGIALATEVNQSSEAHLDLVCADAQKLPFADHRFDVLTVGYGLRNLADWRLGLAEMFRVLRPGGRLLVLDFGKPDLPFWRTLYFCYLKMFVPLLGLTFCGSASAYAYILESLKHYPAQHGVAAALREIGFANTRIVTFLGGVMTINYAEKRPS
jgi:demethylmenaquinone methyltransferase / 2-methoxy-6-polyprenyl-1,4-benzoquinol methylase